MRWVLSLLAWFISLVVHIGVASVGSSSWLCFPGMLPYSLWGVGWRSWVWWHLGGVGVGWSCRGSLWGGVFRWCGLVDRPLGCDWGPSGGSGHPLVLGFLCGCILGMLGPQLHQ